MRRFATCILTLLLPAALAAAQAHDHAHDAPAQHAGEPTGVPLPEGSMPSIPALHMAARANELPTIQRLLGEGVDVNLQMTEGEDWLNGSTPLMWAAREGDAATVRFLLDFGANPRIRSVNGTTALNWGAVSKVEPYEKTMMLLDAGAEVHGYRDDGTPLVAWVAGLAKDARIMEAILERGADLTLRMRRERLTPLMAAARGGNAATLPVILARKPDLEARAENGFTALIYAAEGNTGTPEVIDMLAKAGADLDARDKDGSTALMIGSRLKHAARVERLVELGADVSAVNNRGETALMYACASGDPESALALLNGGADPNRSTATGLTPLMLAVQFGEPICIRLLISRGADVNARSVEGWTPLLLARSTSSAEPVIDAGADLEASTVEGWTAAHFAANDADLFLLRKLANAGANLEARDNAGNTPLLLAEHGAATNPESETHRATLAYLREKLGAAAPAAP